MKPWRITLTGIDPGCPQEELVYLSDRYCLLEWAILYSRDRAGRGRYPTVEWINRTAGALAVAGRPVALHVCGAAVGHLLEHGALPELGSLQAFFRIQLNGRIEDADGPKIASLIDRLNRTVITQYDQNPGLALTVNRPAYHQYLFDASGGRGLLRDQWPTPDPHVSCGYAGGLGPDNLAQELPRIAKAAGDHPFWIDMESRLRTADDRFSLEAARRTLAAVDKAASLL